MRAVRYAVATAYIFLYASDAQTASTQAKQDRPKLVELAHRGAGVERDDQQTPHGRSVPTKTIDSVNPGDADTVSKLRLYSDHVTVPFKADAESSKWTDDAIRELRQVVVTSKQQLSDL
jgi:hypothetical protein